MPLWSFLLFLLSLLLGAITASAASYSSLNIDSGAASTAPEDNYAAAGNQGHWTLLERLDSSPRGEFYDDQNLRPPWLQNLTIESNQTLVNVTPNAQPFSDGDAALLGDYLVSGRDQVEITFRGLLEGTYTLILYFVGRQDYPSSTSVSVRNSTESLPSQTTTGVWDGAFALGVSHALFKAEVNADGTLIVAIDAYGDAFINGLQLTNTSAPRDLGPSISNCLDQKDWAWEIAGDGWAWPLPGEDEIGGVGIEGSLSHYQNSSLSTQIDGPTHLKFYWSAQLPQNTQLSLIVNDTPFTTIQGEEELNGHFQLYLPEVNNTVTWQIRNIAPGERENFAFVLDSTEKVGSAMNQLPVLHATSLSFSPETHSTERLKPLDPDGDTPIFLVSSDYPEDAYTRFRLPPGIAFKNTWNGQATLDANATSVSDLGLYPLFVSLNDGGEEVKQELTLEITNPFKPGLIQRVTPQSTQDFFGSAIENYDLIDMEADRAWLYKTDFSQLVEYSKTASGNWQANSTVEPPTSAPFYEFLETVAIDQDQIAILAKASDNEERFLLVYIRNVSENWDLQAELPFPGELEDSRTNIDLDGRWLATTNPNYENPENNSVGRLFIYERSADQGWQLNSQFPVTGTQTGGRPLQINENYLVLGACYEPNYEIAQSIEIIYLLEYSNSEGWQQNKRFESNSTGPLYSGFGRNLALDGSQLVIAHPFEEPNGAVLIYELSHGEPPRLLQKIQEDTANKLGTSLAVGNDWILAGDESSSINSAYGGAAYGYTRSTSDAWERSSLIVSKLSQIYASFGRQAFVSENQPIILNNGGQIHSAELLNFNDWYQKTSGKKISSWLEALSSDENQNEVADGLDYFQRNHSANSPLTELSQHSIGNSQYRGIQLQTPVTHGLNWEVEYSKDLKIWSSESVRLLQSGDQQVWGVPVSQTEPCAFFRIRILPPTE